jgi:hypothetical protein
MMPSDSVGALPSLKDMFHPAGIVDRGFLFPRMERFHWPMGGVAS